MSFDLTRGEIMLIAFILGLVYTSGLLPKVVNALSKARPEDGSPSKTTSEDGSLGSEEETTKGE